MQRRFKFLLDQNFPNPVFDVHSLDDTVEHQHLSAWRPELAQNRTPDWLLYFGLLFVAFIVYSPTGLVGVWRRLTEPMRAPVVEAAAMSGRTAALHLPLPEFLKRTTSPSRLAAFARSSARASRCSGGPCMR